MPPRPNPRAFTRIELLAVSAVLGMMMLVVLPTLASNKTDSERFLCFNNLRMIGRAVQMWAGDHNQQPPWRSPVTEGGLYPSSGTRAGNAWFDLTYMSNELFTPKILACPSDVGVKRATEFGGNTNGGFFSPPFRGAALSYVVGLESGGDSPRSWVSGDRNIYSWPAGSCSSRVNNVSQIDTWAGLVSTRWTNGVHGEFGHILLLDGSVEFTSSQRLRTVLIPEMDDNGTIHFLRAR
jgi:type II secretory pathway pseudopilin PulG